MAAGSPINDRPFLRWLFLDESRFSSPDNLLWKISALRIILVSGLVLEALIAIHSSIKAVALGAYHIVAIVLAFYALISCALYYSARRPAQGAAILLVTVYAAGAAILLFIRRDEIARLGILFVYTAPIIARIFFGFRLAVVLMLLNALPFLYLLDGNPFPRIYVLDTTLEHSHIYIQSLLFLFFNVCIPLAVFRVLHALDASAQRYREINRALEKSHAQFREFFENSGGPILLCEANGGILQANRMANQLLGRDPQSAPGDLLFDWLKPGGNDEKETCPVEKSPTPLPDLAEKGEFVTHAGCHVVLDYLTPTSLQHFIVVLRDSSNLRLMQKALQRSQERESFLNDHDRLTQLPNREKLRKHLAQLLEQKSTRPNVALVSFRLESIRHANEKYGTRIGDALIRRFAAELCKALAPQTVCARLRGMVFSFAIQAHNAAEITGEVDRIRMALPKEISIEEHDLFIQTSTGIALARPGDVSPEELMRRSEVALDTARRATDDPIALFDEADAARIRRSVDIELGIVAALNRREFRLVYQPKVNEKRQPIALEALIRWDSPNLGEVSPAEFIPVAENCGLIHEITRFVIDEACAFIRRALDQGYACLPVAINLSAIDIIREDLLELIDTTSSRYGTPCTLLEFEITETGLIGNESLAIHHLQELEKRGNNIAIDDFGTGYSSLAKLSSFPVHGIKIDRSFVARIGSCKKSELIIRAIVSLAATLSYTVIAEGVENEAQEAFLKALGCNVFQGYFYHLPQEEKQIRALLPTARTTAQGC